MNKVRTYQLSAHQRAPVQSAYLSGRLLYLKEILGSLFNEQGESAGATIIPVSEWVSACYYLFGVELYAVQERRSSTL